MPRIKVGALRDRTQLLATGQGLIAETASRFGIIGSGAPTAGTIYLGGVGLRAGDVVTNIVCHVGTAGSGTAPTLIRQGLLDKTGKVLAVTADTHASSSWTAGNNSAVSQALSAAYTVTADDLYFLAFLEVGAWGTTALTLARTSTAVIAGVGSAPSPFPTGGAGQTDLPAVASSVTLGAASNAFWLAAS